MARTFALVALIAAGTGVSMADTESKPQKEEASFGAIRSVDAAEAQKQAKAWLAGVKNDAATMAEFEKIWAADRPVLDKVASTLALGDKDAAKLLAEARDTESAPTEVPSILTDKEKPEFYRNNLGLAYARILASRKIYEEALDTFQVVKGDEVVDPAAFYFHKAVCEYELMLKDKADGSIDRLLADVTDSPERYTRVAALMHFDMLAWQDKDLGWIARKMENIQRRLDLKRGGKQTQKQQKEVLVRLDEMIKEIENKQKQQQGGGSCPNGGGCPNGGQPGPDGEGKEKSSSPAKDTIKSNAQTPGVVDPRREKEIAEQWGKLPEKERAKALVELTRGLPAQDRAVIEAYFKRLAELSETEGK